MPGERGDHCVARFAGGARERANQADLRVSQRPAAFCYKICALKPAHDPQRCLSRPRSQMAGGGRISGICLECAAIFRHLPLTVRWGLGSI